jgi:serine/threonine protein kinase
MGDAAVAGSVFVSWRDVTYSHIGAAGSGGIGAVSKALATSGPNKGITFAVKVFTPDTKEKEAWRQGFMREVHVLRDCDHPAIVKVFDEGVLPDGRPFFVMEYLPEDLQKAMRNRLPEKLKMSIVMQLLSALSYLARRDPYVVHRDIKPPNIFMKAGTCVLGDFGLIFHDAPGAGEDTGRIPKMAQRYRTPELVAFHQGGPKPPPASDVFQLGLVASELFTGQNPLKHSGPENQIELSPLAEIPGPLGEPIRELLASMLTLDTNERPTASALLRNWQELFLTFGKRQAAGRRAAELLKEAPEEVRPPGQTQKRPQPPAEPNRPASS